MSIQRWDVYSQREEKLQKITTGRPHTASHLAYQTTRSHWIRKVNLNWPGHSLFNWANRMDKPRWGNCWYSRQINFHWIPVSPGDAKHTKEPPCCDTGRHILSCQSQFRVQSNENNPLGFKSFMHFKCLEKSYWSSIPPPKCLTKSSCRIISCFDWVFIIWEYYKLSL